MKRTIFGVMLMVFGAVMFIAATTLFAVSAQSSDEYISETSSLTQSQEPVENKVYTGEYYLNGDAEKESISVSDSSLTFSDGTVKDYTLSVWKNMPETDEQSGLITYVDYCFLKIGGDKVSYDPAEKEIVFGDMVYRLVG
ncbi:MAG: hypothetical protein HDT48_02285 [Ruminococcaceae bacterium]|nr:hypothetical protein [Oscillospiraceae bacterium]